MGNLIVVYPKPYSIYLRGTISRKFCTARVSEVYAQPRPERAAELDAASLTCPWGWGSDCGVKFSGSWLRSLGSAFEMHVATNQLRCKWQFNGKVAYSYNSSSSAATFMAAEQLGVHLTLVSVATGLEILNAESDTPHPNPSACNPPPNPKPQALSPARP